MPATRRALRHAVVRLLVAVTFVTALSGAVEITTAGKAEAVVSASTGARAVTAVATRKGAQYKRGAVGPTRFDCSGLIKWTYARVGKVLPRTANEQYRATTRIKANSRRPGDLVFFMSGNRAYHVAVYAGHNRIWHAPKPGSRVKRVVLWTSKVRYTRVR